MKQDEEIDLGLKLGTPEQAFWNRTKNKAKEEILSCKREIEINELIIKHAEKRIKEEENNGK